MGSNKSVEMSYSTQKPFQKNFDSLIGAGEGSVALGKVGLSEVITNHYRTNWTVHKFVNTSTIVTSHKITLKLSFSKYLFETRCQFKQNT